MLAGKSPNIRSYTVHKYGSGQPNISVTPEPRGQKRKDDQARLLNVKLYPARLLNINCTRPDYRI